VAPSVQHSRRELSKSLGHVTERTKGSAKDGKSKGKYKEGIGSSRTPCRLAVFPSRPVIEWLTNSRLYLQRSTEFRDIFMSVSRKIAGGPENWVSVSGKGTEFLPHHRVQTGS
jgi:hypothetical protein